MKRWIIPAAIAVMAVGYIALRDTKPADFSAQFITLPSGRQAYCNRQGYREIKVQTGRLRIENILVTDPNNNFVACDARVGPPGDELRTDENGNLLNDEQIRERYVERQRQQEEAERPERERQQAMADARNQAELAYWAEKRQRDAEHEAAREAKEQADEAVREAEEARVQQQSSNCEKTFEGAVEKATSEGWSVASDAALRRANDARNRCVAAIRQR